MFHKKRSEFQKSLNTAERLAYLLDTLKGMRNCSEARNEVVAMLVHELQRLHDLQK